MAVKYRVLQVKGAQEESFIVVGIDFEAGTITSTTEMMLRIGDADVSGEIGRDTKRDRRVDGAGKEVSRAANEFAKKLRRCSRRSMRGTVSPQRPLANRA